jgi:hypothetical protein
MLLFPHQRLLPRVPQLVAGVLPPLVPALVFAFLLRFAIYHHPAVCMPAGAGIF